jgi:hypothetical protein
MPIDYFAQQFGEDVFEDTAPADTGIATLTNNTQAADTSANTGIATVTNNTSADTSADTSAFNYESVYDVFGGEDATNDLIATFRSMGLDDNAIASVLAPYQKTTTAATTTADTTTADTTTADTTTADTTTADTTTADTTTADTTTADTTTADTTNNELSGVILAGDSWLAGDDFTNIANTAFDENVTNTAIGGQTTADV